MCSGLTSFLLCRTMVEERRKLEQERAELNALIGKGVSFEVQDVEVIERKYLWGMIRKKSITPITRKFVVEEPTLGTLDRLSSEWVEMAIDEEALKGEDGMRQARIMAKSQAIRCARVIAIAVLGSDYLIPKPSKGREVRYVKDSAKLEELTDLFARRIKPSELYQLYVLIQAMEIVKQGQIFSGTFFDQPDTSLIWQPSRYYHGERGFGDNMRDTVSAIPALLMFSEDILNERGLQPNYLKAYDVLILGKEKPNARKNKHGFYERDTIAYVPNSVLREAEKKIYKAYADSNYTEVYRLFHAAYKFKPITGKQWQRLKAAGQN